MRIETKWVIKKLMVSFFYPLYELIEYIEFYILWRKRVYLLPGISSQDIMFRKNVMDGR